jgi:hypothetical protein
MKKTDYQTNLINDAETKKQMSAIDREVHEKEAINEGPFIVFIKKPDGTIESYSAKTLWRLIFSLTIALQNKYSAFFEKGIVFKIVKGSAGSDQKSV